MKHLHGIFILIFLLQSIFGVGQGKDVHHYTISTKKNSTVLLLVIDSIPLNCNSDVLSVELSINDTSILVLEEFKQNKNKIKCFLSLKTKKNIIIYDTAIIKCDSNIIAIPFKYQRQKVKSEDCMQIVDSLVKEKKYTDALLSIKKNKQRINDTIYTTFYSKYFSEGLKHWYNKDLLYFFSFSESKLNAQNEPFLNYDSLKMTYLKKKYHELKQNNSDNRVKLMYLNSLISIVPNSIKYKIDLYNINGDIALSKNKYSTAIDNYYQSYQLSNSKYRKNKIVRILITIVKENCGKNSRRSLWKNYRLFKKYSKLVESSFELNYYAACTNYRLANYKGAEKHYLYLKNNYAKSNKNEKDLISIEEINKKLYDLLLKNCYFQQSCTASQALCYETENNDSIKLMVNNYLASFKGSYILTIINAFKAYYFNNKSKKINNLTFKFNKQLFRTKSDIKSIFIYNPKNNTQTLFLGKENNNLNIKIKHLNSFPVLTNEITDNQNNYFLIDKLTNSINGPLIVISYENITGVDKEKDFLGFLINKKNSSEFWNKLNNFERNRMEKLFSYYISEILSHDDFFSHTVLSKYWEYLKLNKNLVRYLAVFNQNGNKIFNENLHLNNYTYNKLLWEKSKITPVFLKQDVTDVKQNIIITDISLPVQNSRYIAVLKLGLNKICF